MNSERGEKGDSPLFLEEKRGLSPFSISDVLNEDIATLSPDIRQRLQQMRIAALTSAPPPRVWPSLAPTAGVLASTVLCLVLAAQTIEKPQAVPAPHALEWMTSEVSAAELEIAEDLDFYQWLAARDAG